MEIQFIILIFLILLGLIDLSIGVANDAVNFTNSAIGSRVAKFRTIMIVAGLGVLLGVLYSGGMMEIARKGVFNPAYFKFEEVMVILLSAMVADVILLDFYNTYGLPTSTTVSIISDLLGAALGVAVYKIVQTTGNFAELGNYINVAKVTSIFISIIVSIIFAFVFGFLVQYIARIIFSFNYKPKMKYFGAMFGSIAFIFMSYFVLIKGLKNAPFVTKDTITFINNNILYLMGISFVFLTVIFQLIISLFKYDILKFVVLFGTFALSMSFAANDLVNFVGVPLAGLDAYNIAHAADNPFGILMGELGNSTLKPHFLFLLLAGAIMFATLFFSKKARTVTKTEISLGRQSEGYERFQSNALARGLVSISIIIIDFLKRITPESIQIFIRKQFDTNDFNSEVDENGERSSFDIVRATVILAISSALISLGTAFKLPLSTTYITFIAAMSAALPDKAWGRESAVYRVSGVITVVGGWFMTALFAVIIAFLIALFLINTGSVGVFISMGVLIALFWRSNVLHKSRAKKSEEMEKVYVFNSKEMNSNYYQELLSQIANYLHKNMNTMSQSLDRLIHNDVLKLRKIRYESRDTSKELSVLSINMVNLLNVPDERMDEFMNYSTKIMSNLQNLADRIQLLTEQNYYYVANSHTQMSDEQVVEIETIITELNKLSDNIIDVINNVAQYEEAEIDEKIGNFKKLVEQYNKIQLERVKVSPKPIKRNLLYFTILSDVDLIADNTKSLYKSLRKVFKKITKEK